MNRNNLISFTILLLSCLLKPHPKRLQVTMSWTRRNILLINNNAFVDALSTRLNENNDDQSVNSITLHREFIREKQTTFFDILDTTIPTVVTYFRKQPKNVYHIKQFSCLDLVAPTIHPYETFVLFKNRNESLQTFGFEYQTEEFIVFPLQATNDNFIFTIDEWLTNQPIDVFPQPKLPNKLYPRQFRDERNFIQREEYLSGSTSFQDTFTSPPTFTQKLTVVIGLSREQQRAWRTENDPVVNAFINKIVQRYLQRIEIKTSPTLVLVEIAITTITVTYKRILQPEDVVKIPVFQFCDHKLYHFFDVIGNNGDYIEFNNCEERGVMCLNLLSQNNNIDLLQLFDLSTFPYYENIRKLRYWFQQQKQAALRIKYFVNTYDENNNTPPPEIHIYNNSETSSVTMLDNTNTNSSSSLSKKRKAETGSPVIEEDPLLTHPFYSPQFPYSPTSPAYRPTSPAYPDRVFTPPPPLDFSYQTPLRNEHDPEFVRYLATLKEDSSGGDEYDREQYLENRFVDRGF